MAAGDTQCFTARHQFRIAFFAFKADKAPGAVSGAESVFFAFTFVNNQQAHFLFLLVDKI
jgi:hypothetical protein